MRKILKNNNEGNMHEDTHHDLISKRIESNDDYHLDMKDQDYHFQEDLGYFQS